MVCRLQGSRCAKKKGNWSESGRETLKKRLLQTGTLNYVCKGTIKRGLTFPIPRTTMPLGVTSEAFFPNTEENYCTAQNTLFLVQVPRLYFTARPTSTDAGKDDEESAINGDAVGGKGQAGGAQQGRGGQRPVVMSRAMRDFAGLNEVGEQEHFGAPKHFFI